MTMAPAMPRSIEIHRGPSVGKTDHRMLATENCTSSFGLDALLMGFLGGGYEDSKGERIRLDDRDRDSALGQYRPRRRIPIGRQG